MNDKISSIRHDKFPEHLPIQKWYIKQHQQIVNHPRVPKPRLKQANIKFGAYVQVYIHTTNITKQSMVGSIARRPEKKRGGYYFMYLATRKHPQTFIWKKLPINDQVMQRVNDLNTKENKPKITKGYLFFE